MSKELKEFTQNNPDLASEIFRNGVIEGTKHSAPSPQTVERFEKLEHCLQDLTEAIHRLEVHSVERAKKIDEMYDYVVKGQSVVWFIKWLAGTAAALGGLVVLFKSIANNGN